MRLLLLADLHLGARLLDWGEEASSRRDELRRGWKDAVAFALTEDNAVDAVLVAGNLFDRPEPDPPDAALVIEGMERMLAAGRSLVLLPGSYDGLSHPKSLYLSGRLPDGANIVTWEKARRTEIAVGAERLFLYGFAWIPGRTPNNPFVDLRRGDGDGYHVGLISARWDEDEPNRVPLFWGCPPFPHPIAETSGLDLLVLGGSTAPRDTKAGKTTVVQPGSPLGMRPDETEAHGFVVADLQTSGVRLERRERVASSARAGQEPAAVSSGQEDAIDPSPDAAARASSSGIRGLFEERILQLHRQAQSPRERAMLKRALTLGLRELDNREATLAH